MVHEWLIHEGETKVLEQLDIYKLKKSYQADN